MAYFVNLVVLNSPMGKRLRFGLCLVCFMGQLTLLGQIKVKAGTTLDVSPGTNIWLNSTTLTNFEIQPNAIVKNDGVIVFSDSTELIEYPGHPITGTGYEETQRIYSTPLSTFNVGGFGLEITTTNILDTLLLKRGHVNMIDQTANPSITRWYVASPSNNAGLNATLSFNYDTTEVNTIDESKLKLQSSFDGGGSWHAMGGTVDTMSHQVTLSGIDSLAFLSGFPITLLIDSLSDINACENQGDSIMAIISINGLFNIGNFFVLELSDELGDFASPVLLDSVLSTTSTSISTTLPVGAATGTSYKLRIRATDALCISPNHSDSLSINPIPIVSLTGLLPVYCKSDSNSVLTGVPGGGVFSGSGILSNTFYPSLSDSGQVLISYLYTDSNGCSNQSTDSTFVFNGPPVPTIQQGGGVLASSASSGNQWYYNGNPLIGEIGQFHSFGQLGFYQVEVTDQNGCTAISGPFNVVGLNEKSIVTTLSVYPNPTSESITVHFATPLKHQIHLKLTGISGRLAYVSTMEAGLSQATMPTENISPGVYILHISDNYEEKRIKVIVE